jgi:P27 family predicted phage terminase small subunit
MPGPKPTPTHLKLLRGNPGQRPINKREPKPSIAPEPPEPPDFLSPAAKDEWWRIVPELHALGLLTVLDLKVLAAYCSTAAHWEAAERMLRDMAERDPVTGALLIKTAAGNAMYNPVIGIARKAAQDMVRIAAEFGFSPAARTRIQLGVTGQLSGSKFAGVLGGSRGDD